MHITSSILIFLNTLNNLYISNIGSVWCLGLPKLILVYNVRQLSDYGRLLFDAKRKFSSFSLLRKVIALTTNNDVTQWLLVT